MRKARRKCQVLISSDKVDGTPATTFQVINDSGSEWFLDFMTGDTIVTRIRVQESFLPVIRDLLQNALKKPDTNERC